MDLAHCWRVRHLWRGHFYAIDRGRGGRSWNHSKWIGNGFGGAVVWPVTTCRWSGGAVSGKRRSKPQRGWRATSRGPTRRRCTTFLQQNTTWNHFPCNGVRAPFTTLWTRFCLNPPKITRFIKKVNSNLKYESIAHLWSIVIKNLFARQKNYSLIKNRSITRSIVTWEEPKKSLQVTLLVG